MKAWGIAAVAATVWFAPASAQPLPDVGVQVLNVLHTQRTYRANVAVNNNLREPLRSVFVHCTFFGEDRKPVDTAPGLISNMRAFERAHTHVSIVDDIPVSAVTCRVGNVSR